MKATTYAGDDATATSEQLTAGSEQFQRLLGEPAKDRPGRSQSGMVIGELVGMKTDGRIPLVLYAGQSGTAAVPARAVIDLHGHHIGRKVALVFECSDPAKPIVMGLLRDGDGWPLAPKPEHVDVEADGERLVVSARRQLVLRCGKASITLTEDGKVLVQGTFLSSRSSGVNRIRGGSVQIN